MRSPCFFPPRSSIRCSLRALCLLSTRTELPQSPEPASVDKLQAPTQHALCLPTSWRVMPLPLWVQGPLPHLLQGWTPALRGPH